MVLEPGVSGETKRCRTGSQASVVAKGKDRTARRVRLCSVVLCHIGQGFGDFQPQIGVLEERLEGSKPRQPFLLALFFD